MKAWNVKIRDANTGKVLKIVIVHGPDRASAQSLALDHYCTVKGTWVGAEACEASPNKTLNAQSVLCKEYSKHLDNERKQHAKR